LKFRDGEPVRAVDCVASIRRWSARDVAGQAVAAATDATDAIDDRSFRIRLKVPFPLLLRAGSGCLDRFPRTISGVLPGLLSLPHRGWDEGRA
jgi:hypothetical protein